MPSRLQLENLRCLAANGSVYDDSPYLLVTVDGKQTRFDGPDMDDPGDPDAVHDWDLTFIDPIDMKDGTTVKVALWDNDTIDADDYLDAANINTDEVTSYVYSLNEPGGGARYELTYSVHPYLPAPTTLPDRDPSIVGVVLVQVIQEPDNSIPLFQRRTLVRVYVDSGRGNGGARAGIKTAYVQYDTGFLVSPSDVDPAMGFTAPAIETLDLGVSYAKSETLNFEVPDNYLGAGFTVHVEVPGYAPLTWDVDQYPLRAQRVIPIRPVVYQRDDLTEATQSEIDALLDSIREIYPVELDVKPTLYAPLPEDLRDKAAWKRLATALEDYQDEYLPREIVMGVVPHPPAGKTIWDGGVSGLTHTKGQNTFVCHPMISVEIPDNVAPHELGHAWVALGHSACGGAEDLDDDAMTNFSTHTDGVRMFPTTDFEIRPSNSGDLMSYCFPTWPSAVTYRKLIDRASRP